MKEFYIFPRTIYRKEFVTICPGDMGGGGSTRLVTNGDKGGREVQNSQFCGDVIFEWPHELKFCLEKCLGCLGMGKNCWAVCLGQAWGLLGDVPKVEFAWGLRQNLLGKNF